MVLYDQGKSHSTRRIPLLTNFFRRPERSGHCSSICSSPRWLTSWTRTLALANTPAEARAAVLASRAMHPGNCYEYSDLGADILDCCRSASGQPLNEFSTHNVFAPLGMNDTHFVKCRDVARYSAHRNCAAQRLPIRGEVHDENAYALGGVAGHADYQHRERFCRCSRRMLLEKRSVQRRSHYRDSTVALFTHRRKEVPEDWGGIPATAMAVAVSTLVARLGHRLYWHVHLDDPDRQILSFCSQSRACAKAKRPSKVLPMCERLGRCCCLAVMDDPAAC